MGRSSSRCLSQRSSKCRSQFQMTRYLMAQQQGRTRGRTSRCPARAGRQTTCPLRRINLRLGGGSVIFRLPTIGEAQPGRLAKKKSAPTSTKSGLRRSQNPTATTSPITQAAAQRGAWRRFVTFFPQARALITAIHSLQPQAGKPMRNRTSKSTINFSSITMPA